MQNAIVQNSVTNDFGTDRDQNALNVHINWNHDATKELWHDSVTEQPRRGYPDKCHPGQLLPQGYRGAGTCSHTFFMFFFVVQWKWIHH